MLREHAEPDGVSPSDDEGIDMTARPHTSRWCAVAAALVLLAGCSSGTETGGTDEAPTSPAGQTTSGGAESAPTATGAGTPQRSVAQVRRSLATLDPCALLTTPAAEGVDDAYGKGPHTCSGTVGDVRVTVEVGVPFDKAARSDAGQRSVAGLAAYRDDERCRVVFAAGDSHGIAVRAGRADCSDLDPAAELVGSALSTGGPDVRRPTGPDHVTACGLLATEDSDTLTDEQGSTAAGLDHCAAADQPVSTRDHLDLTYLAWSFDRLTRQLGGKARQVAGHDVAVVDEGQQGCHVHTYLWPTRADGRGRVHTEATVSGKDCERALTLTKRVLAAADEDPPTGADPAELLVAAD